MNRNCPVCGSAKIDSIAFFENYPIIVFPVPKNVSKNMDCKNLSICMCLECYHQYQINYNIDFNQKLYSKYYQFYPYSNIECFIEHYRKPFEELFSSFNFPNLNSNRLLEVGLSDASQLKYFLDKKFEFELYEKIKQLSDSTIVVISHELDKLCCYVDSIFIVEEEIRIFEDKNEFFKSEFAHRHVHNHKI